MNARRRHLRTAACLTLVGLLACLPLAAASAEALSALEGEFTPSEFVRGTVGVDNVCERAALYASREGRVIMKKHAAGGVTAAAAVDRWTCGFGEETG